MKKILTIALILLSLTMIAQTEEVFSFNNVELVKDKGVEYLEGGGVVVMNSNTETIRFQSRKLKGVIELRILAETLEVEYFDGVRTQVFTVFDENKNELYEVFVTDFDMTLGRNRTLLRFYN